jgi:hypothetical protein
MVIVMISIMPKGGILNSNFMRFSSDFIKIGNVTFLK